MNKGKIAFLMPEVASLPMGGYKVVFEYANRFVVDGYEVCVVLPSSLITQEVTLGKVTRKWLRYLFYMFVKDYKPTSWFKLDDRVQFRFVPSLDEFYAPRADFYIATAVQTAYYLNRYRIKAAKFYFIQGYEFWGMGVDKLHQSYKFDMRKLVVSDYLKHQVEAQGQDAVRIPNGFNFDLLRTFIPQVERDPYCLCTMYHSEPLKGFFDTLQAVDIVHKKHPQVKLLVFGTQPQQFDQEYIEFTANPTPDELCGLYNRASIFIGASHSEGWGLTIGEAMICSCAVVCTDNGGYREMAQDNKTALVSPVADIGGLSNSIIRFVDNPQLRFTIAQNGHEYISNFTWDKSYQIFRKEIENAK